MGWIAICTLSAPELNVQKESRMAKKAKKPAKKKAPKKAKK